MAVEVRFGGSAAILTSSMVDLARRARELGSVAAEGGGAALAGAEEVAAAAQGAAALAQV